MTSKNDPRLLQQVRPKQERKKYNPKHETKILQEFEEVEYAVKKLRFY